MQQVLITLACYVGAVIVTAAGVGLLREWEPSSLRGWVGRLGVFALFGFTAICLLFAPGYLA